MTDLLTPLTSSTEADDRLLSARIADELRSVILDGQMQPGARIRQEDLATRFGASRIPVREALRQLESEGLVLLVPNSGAWIAKINPEECVELYKMRELLEPLAMSESVLRLSEGEITMLDQMVQQMEAMTSVEDYIRQDRQFHLLCYSKAKMPRLLAMIEQFWNSTQHYRRSLVAGIFAKQCPFSDPHHRIILDAVKERDVEAVRTIIYLHIRRTRIHIQKIGS
jgi:DNA-binding GntR family transcriptional regulator